MSLLDGLIKIFPGLKKARAVFKSFSDNKTIVINNNNTNNIKAKNVVNINLKEYSPEQIESLSKLIKKTFNDDREEVLLIDEKSEEIVTSFGQKEHQNKDTLEFFRDKLPKEDLIILRAALFIKALHEENKPVGHLKYSLVGRYGQRAGNITNLCTAGYYESLIKPLYEELSQSDTFTHQSFLDKYEVIVAQYPFAVFVNHMMSVQDVKNTILSKIELNKKYGVKFLTIHGIGFENLEKIKEVLNDNELLKELAQSPEIESGQNFITVRILFVPIVPSNTLTNKNP